MSTLTTPRLPPPGLIAYDDFETGAGTIAGRVPQVGSGAWSQSGAGSNAIVGSGYISAAGNTYCYLSMASTPREIGGVFEMITSGGGVTIGCLLNSGSLADMLHFTFGSSTGTSISGLYWKTAVATSAALAGGTTAVLALVTGTRYVARFVIEAPYCDLSVETTAGVVLGSARFYEPNMASIIGPNVFFQLNGGVNRWHEVWAYAAPSANTTSYQRMTQGIDGTSIGRTAQAAGAFQSLVVGQQARPSGSSSLTLNIGSSAERPVFIGRNADGELLITSDTSGNAALLELKNGAGGFARMYMDGAYVHYLTTSNGGAWLSKPWGATPYFGAALGIGGSAGPTFTAGVGTPEAVVTAIVGSLFLRTDGAAVTTLYVKTTGAGNTGWTAK